MSHTIHHQEQDAKGAFYIAHDGQRLAEMTYSRTNATMVIVDHTEVDPSLSGQGVGRALLGRWWSGRGPRAPRWSRCARLPRHSSARTRLSATCWPDGPVNDAARRT